MTRAVEESPLTFVSLFAGIGGIDLGLERAGMRCVGQVEIDPHATQVLARHWPDTPRHEDVRTFHGTEFGPFDLLAGGYPCQPFSNAGLRKGEADPRHLWPEVLRVIRNVRPRLVLLENVPGHLTLGFGRVLGDLAESGYDAEWDCVPASAVGAPHRRDRVFVLAYPQGEPGYGGCDHTGERVASGPVPQFGDGGRAAHVADSNRGSAVGTPIAWAERHPWQPEPDVGRVADGVPRRVDRLRGLGNAVVPQVAEYLGRRIMEAFA